MVDASIVNVVKNYLKAVNTSGIHADRAVLFGSYARGEANQWSDIDLVVIAPELEPPVEDELVSELWKLRVYTDSRIEPFACGEKEWETDDTRPILEIARREGEVIAA